MVCLLFFRFSQLLMPWMIDEAQTDLEFFFFNLFSSRMSDLRQRGKGKGKASSETPAAAPSADASTNNNTNSNSNSNNSNGGSAVVRPDRCICENLD